MAPVDKLTLLNEHRATWTFETSIGDITLRKERYTDYIRTNSDYFTTNPDKEKDFQRLAYISLVGENSATGLSPEQEAERDTLLKSIQGYFDAHSLNVFAEPVVCTVEERDAILEGLKPQERKSIEESIAVLTSSDSTSDVISNMANLCKTFGVPLTAGLTLENMTVAQARMLADAADTENKAVQNEMRRLQQECR